MSPENRAMPMLAVVPTWPAAAGDLGSGPDRASAARSATSTRLLLVGLQQDHRELVATQPGHDVGLATRSWISPLTRAISSSPREWPRESLMYLK